MKTNVVIVVSLAILLTSCTPGVPAQDVEVTPSVPIKVAFTKTPEPVVTQGLTATETPTPTIVPSKTPPGCVTLLTPSDGAEMPAVGKVTFSWSPMNEAMFYALQIMTPSGETILFETSETFRDQYIEVFSAGGEYQWNVIAQDRKRKEICSSALAIFSKPASTPPKQTKDDDNKKKK